MDPGGAQRTSLPPFFFFCSLHAHICTIENGCGLVKSGCVPGENESSGSALGPAPNINSACKLIKCGPDSYNSVGSRIRPHVLCTMQVLSN